MKSINKWKLRVFIFIFFFGGKLRVFIEMINSLRRCGQERMPKMGNGNEDRITALQHEGSGTFIYIFTMGIVTVYLRSSAHHIGKIHIILSASTR